MTDTEPTSKCNHVAATEHCKALTENPYLGPTGNLKNLAACYLDLHKQLAEFQRLARASSVLLT